MYNDTKTIEFMKKSVDSLKKGSLRFWGEWFGRPLDNCHIIIDVQFNSQEDTLIVRFNEGETLTVFNPENIKADSEEFYIRSASNIKWEWFSYGQPQIEENLYYKQYRKQGCCIFVTSGKGTLEYFGQKIIEATGQHAAEIC